MGNNYQAGSHLRYIKVFCRQSGDRCLPVKAKERSVPLEFVCAPTFTWRRTLCEGFCSWSCVSLCGPLPQRQGPVIQADGRQYLRLEFVFVASPSKTAPLAFLSVSPAKASQVARLDTSHRSQGRTPRAKHSCLEYLPKNRSRDRGRCRHMTFMFRNLT